MDLSAPHRVPLTWLMEHGGDTIRLRTLRDLAPTGREGIEALETAIVTSKAAAAIAKRQKDTGVFGANFLGIAPSARDGIKEPGTIAQVRRLQQLGYPRTGRAFKLADRLLFRVLSRDEDPSLLFEYQKLAKESPAAAEWLRDQHREAAAVALAEVGHLEDPRLRGAAHKVASEVSGFLRSELADKPFTKSGNSAILHPAAHPPTWYSWAMVAAMPNLQRERASFTERLGQYLAMPAPQKTYTIQAGKKSLKPTMVLLGDPIECDARGHAKDLPLALLACELLARIGAVHLSVSAMKVLSRLYEECDDRGVWRPARLAAAPRAIHPATYHFYPLAVESKSPEAKFADVTFRLALIARLMGRELSHG